MGESGERELRKTPEGKLRRKETEKGGDTKKGKTGENKKKKGREERREA